MLKHAQRSILYFLLFLGLIVIVCWFISLLNIPLHPNTYSQSLSYEYSALHYYVYLKDLMLDWINLILALFLFTGAIIYHIVKRDGISFIFAIAYLFIGIFHTYHQLSPYFIHEREELRIALISFIWWKSQLFYSIAITIASSIGILCSIFITKRDKQIGVVTFTLYLLLASLFIFTTFLLPFLSSAYIQRSILHRPLLMVPILLLTTIGLPSLLYLYRRNKGYFLLFIIFSVPVSIAGQTVSMFFPGQDLNTVLRIDNIFNIFSLFLPLIGLILDLSHIYQSFESIETEIREEKENKHRLLYYLRHEIYHPIHLLKGSIDYLAESMQDHLDIKQSNRMIATQQHCLDLSYNLQQVEALLRMETGTILYQLQEINVKTLLDHVILLFKKRTKPYPVQIHYEGFQEDILMQSDKERLEHVITQVITFFIQHISNNTVHITTKKAYSTVSIYLSGQYTKEENKNAIDNQKLNIKITIIEKILEGLHVKLDITQPENNCYLFAMTIPTTRCVK